jgi:hypothetical protein
MKKRAWSTALWGLLMLAGEARADYLAPGDPGEYVPLCLSGFGAAILIAAALYGLYRIRRAHDLLPPP